MSTPTMSSPAISTSTPRTTSSESTNGHATASYSAYSSPIFSYPIIPQAFLPGGPKSLPGISLRSFLLGTALGFCVQLSLLLAYIQHDLWRIPAFIAVLAIFHYLEFDTTARYNTADAKISSFLLFNNGWAYTVAHCTAMVECIVRWTLHAFAAYLPSWLRVPQVFPTVPVYVPVGLGLIMVILGQTTRSLAMKTAGKSFNHIVQATKKEGHVLVTEGVYGWSRHPSYFGFFWWGLGTQVLLGNHLCFVAYAAVLWKFFANRIMHEEKHLIEFFGQDYLDYRGRTPVLIPFIR